MDDLSDRIAKLSPKRLAFLALELQSQLDAVQRAATEPIAIVGLGCRFPGSATDPGAFWDLLRRGEDAITEVPGDRWDADAYYDPDPDAIGKMYTKRGGFVRGVDLFDAQFFGISPREAVSLDPQQRLLLEVAWEALESAGQVPEKLLGSLTGVFVGISSGDYMRLQTMSSSPLDIYSGTGNALSVAAGRLSYTLGLQGPCLSIDTACSSSLMAVHLACQSLRNRECAMALAGGVNVILAPDANVILSRGRMLAPDGRCKTFDAAADGYVRAEGCGIVVLKRLSDAAAAGDNILALVRGSAINQDGRSSGLTAPNGPSQEAVIREALARAQVEPGDVTYVETHGTGTPLGDPIEVQALGAVFGAARPPADPLLIGSVKTNVGHLEAAAGIAGLIKVVLALQYGEIPAHVGLRTPNPFIPWASLPVRVTTEPTPWPGGSRRRLAGVSSFGFSGSNAHVVLEEAPVPDRAAQAAAPERPVHVLALSARTQPALRAMAARYADRLQSADAPSIADVCFSANSGRSQLEHRLVAIGASSATVRERLAAFAAGNTGPGIVAGRVDPGAKPDVVFLFTGQGSQYVGMGRGLYETQPVFRAALDECDALLRGELDLPLLDVLYPRDGSPSPLGETRYTQPALFAVEYALTELWRSWGVRPAAVLGHSVGEYVAACVAGVFGLADGLKLVAARARLMQALPAGGAMAAVAADEDRVAAAIAAARVEVSIAAVNAPRQVVVSGPHAGVAAVVSALAADGVRATRLSVSHAFHSALLDPMLDEFERVASGVTYSSPRIDVIANLTGDVAAGEDLVTPGYWRRHARRPVQFARSIGTLDAAGYRVFLEVGPKSTLSAIAQESASDDASWIPSLKTADDAWEQIAGALGALYVRGVPIDWTGFDRPYSRRRVALPSYPFQRQRYWVAGAVAAPPVPAPSPQGSPSLAKYEIAWEPLVQGTPAAHADAARTWIVFADRGGVGAALTDRLTAAGAHVTTVFADEGADAESVRRVLGGAAANGKGCPGVVFLWALDAPALPDGSREPLDGPARGGLLGLMTIAQTLGRARTSIPHLWVVTRGAQPVMPMPGPLVLAQAPVWGMGRVLALEHPELSPRLVDLEPGTPASEADALFDELLRRGDDDQVVRRGDAWYVPRLVAAEASAPASFECSPDATYLVTGGAGALGLRVAGMLAASGARRIVLTGRRGLPARAEWAAVADARTRESIDAIVELERAGVDVDVIRADAADPAEMASLIARLRADRRPLRGVVHAAGVSTLHPLADLEESALADTLRAKVRGAWILHEQTQDLALDFFVMFSSIASVWGSRGQAHYAAANHFLDALAHYRAALGLPALSVNWGPWAGGGMATPEAMHALAGMGVGALDPDAALGALRDLIASRRSQVTVAAMDWGVFKAVLAARARRPLLDRIDSPAPRPAAADSDRDAIVRQLRDAPEAERLARLGGWIEQEVSGVLGAAGLAIEPDHRFFDLGMDSLMTVELRRRLQARFGCSLETTVAFDYPTIEKLSAHVLGRLQQELAEPAPLLAQAARSTPAAKLAELSDEEVDRLFAEKVLQQKS